MFFMAKHSEAFLPVGLPRARAENNCAKRHPDWDHGAKGSIDCCE